jgi:glutamate transport system substrate-binding protein
MANVEQTKKRAIWRYTAIIAACIVLGGIVFWVMRPDSPTPPGPDDNKGNQKSINIGIPINDSPGFSSMQDGQRNGFDIDLANYIADGLGRHPNFVPITVDSREQQLKQHYIDLAISTYSISDKRIAQGVMFAGPYMRTDQGILVDKDNTDINSVEDLEGKTVCVTKGSTTADKLEEFKKTIGVVSLERDTFTQCLDDLHNPSTNVTAITNDSVILQGHAHADKSLKFLPGVVIPGTYEKYGVGLSQDNKTLCQQVSKLLKSFVTTQWNAAFTANIQIDSSQNASSLKPDPSTIDTESCRTD